jgi:hypothetical protein
MRRLFFCGRKAGAFGVAADGNKIGSGGAMAGRGRPPREPSAQERKRVRELVAEGASQRVIAVAIGRSIPNLRKFFATELDLEKKTNPDEAPFKITPAMRADVALMAACNEPHARIARAVGVGEDDLAKYFDDDLQSGAARFRLKTLTRLETLANAGGLGAARALASLTAPTASDTGAAPGPAGYVSKKAAAKADAAAIVNAGGKFAPRRAPGAAPAGGKLN